MWATRPLFWFCGGHPPHPPPGGFAPLDTRFPTPVGRGLAGVLGPTRGGVIRVGCSPLQISKGLTSVGVRIGGRIPCPGLSQHGELQPLRFGK